LNCQSETDRISFGQEKRRDGTGIYCKKQAQTWIAKRKRKRCLMPCGLMNESNFGLLTEGLITKGLTVEESHAMWANE